MELLAEDRSADWDKCGKPSPAMVMIMIIMVMSMIIMIMTSYDMTMITSLTTSPELGHMQPKYTGAGVSENIKSCLVLPSWVYNSRTLSFRSSRRSQKKA